MGRGREQTAHSRPDQRHSLLEMEILGGGDKEKMREQRVTGLSNQERLPGGGGYEEEPGRGQMPPGEDWLIIRRSERMVSWA